MEKMRREKQTRGLRAQGGGLLVRTGNSSFDVSNNFLVLRAFCARFLENCLINKT